MKRIAIAALTALLVSLHCVSAGEPMGTLNFGGTDAQQVLTLYQGLSGLKLIVSSDAKRVHWAITLKPERPVPKPEAEKLIEKALLEQAGIVITKLDGERASVTYNDALPKTPAKTEKTP